MQLSLLLLLISLAFFAPQLFFFSIVIQLCLPSSLLYTVRRKYFTGENFDELVHQDSSSQLNRLHNRAIRIVCGLRKSEHVSQHRRAIGWLPVSLLIQHRTLCGMLAQYMDRGILLNPPIHFGRHHTHDTRHPAYFATVFRCRLALSKHHFRQTAVSWWNLLPQELFSDLTFFRFNLYKYIFSVYFVVVRLLMYLCMYVLLLYVVCNYIIIAVIVLYYVYVYLRMYVVCCMYLYCVLCTLTWKNSFAKCQSLNNKSNQIKSNQ